MLIILPLYIGGLRSWLKNKNTETNKVEQNAINKKEWVLITFSNILLFAGLYFLLKYFNTSELIVSTFSVIATVTATYLIVRRSKYSFLLYIVNDIISIILWGIPVINGNLLLIPILCEPVLLLINDIYGWLEWSNE